MTSPANQLAVVATYQQSTTSLREQLAAFIAALWQSFTAYRNAEMAEFTTQSVPVVEGALQQMQALTSAYLATLDGFNGGLGVPLGGPPVGISDLRNGADPADVYGRSFHLVWRQLADNAPLDGPKIDAAIKSGLDRATQTAMTDLQLAKTHTSQTEMKQSRNTTGYRRQIEGAHTCALCIVAATRAYHKAELMPIHPGCDCSIVPIYGHWPGTVLDENQLADAHDIVSQQFGADSTAARQIVGAFKDNGKPVLYRDVIVTHEHGELGPILGIRGQKFTGPGDIAA